MIFGKKDKNGNRAVNLMFVDGVTYYAKGEAVRVSLNKEIESLTVESRIGKDKSKVNLKYDQITAANVITEKEIIEKSKSTVGRAVAGGVLLGPLGAIVGGMSGIGNKVNSKLKYYMIINYKSREDDIKILSFEIVGASLHWDSFINDLRSKIKVDSTQDKEVYL